MIDEITFKKCIGIKWSSRKKTASKKYIQEVFISSLKLIKKIKKVMYSKMHCNGLSKLHQVFVQQNCIGKAYRNNVYSEFFKITSEGRKHVEMTTIFRVSKLHRWKNVWTKSILIYQCYAEESASKDLMTSIKIISKTYVGILSSSLVFGLRHIDVI